MSLHEECGVWGVYSPECTDVASISYYGLYALQHRGQESCGVVVNDDGKYPTTVPDGVQKDYFERKLSER